MFRTISLLRTRLRSLSQTLTSLPQSSFSRPNLSPFKVHVGSSPSNILLPSVFIFSSPFSRSPSRQKKEDEHNDVSLFGRDPNTPPKLFVVQPRIRPDTRLQAKLSEALNLANSLEEQRDGFFDTELCDKEFPPHVVVQNPAARSIRSDTYFGSGTVENIKCHLNAVEAQGELDAVFINTILSGIQQRNLERAWGKPVMDRVGLIIEIFNAHAQTREAKLQAELAALMYKKSRLVRVRSPAGSFTFGATGEAEVVSARGRGSGGQGFISGAGETELQLQRRRILERRNHLLSQIKEVRRTRALQRAGRKRRGGSDGQGIPTVAVVGYTNAGKSTLVSALSDSDLYSDDRLFATVDPRLRSVVLPSGKKVLFSDTVGFISDLPVQLVEAFYATLEEVVEADLLVHVLDSSAANVNEQRSSVLQVLEQIGVSEEKRKNMVEVWNKIDLQEEETHINEYLDDGDEDKETDEVASELSPVHEDEEAGSFSEAECIEDVDDDVDIVSELSTVDLEEAMDDQQENDFEETMDDQQEGDLSDGQEMVNGVEKEPHSEAQQVPVIKTSAVMGVGLQELLICIDEKLHTPKKLGTGVFDKKWRPPCKDDEIAVEQ